MASSYYHSSSSHQLYSVLAVLILFLSFMLFINYESMLESLMDQLKPVLMVSPLVLLLAVLWLSGSNGRQLPPLIPLPEKQAFHRAGGSPWGVGVLVVVLLFMVSYQSSFHELWFPFSSR